MQHMYFKNVFEIILFSILLNSTALLTDKRLHSKFSYECECLKTSAFFITRLFTARTRRKKTKNNISRVNPYIEFFFFYFYCYYSSSYRHGKMSLATLNEILRNQTVNFFYGKTQQRYALQKLRLKSDTANTKQPPHYLHIVFCQVEILIINVCSPLNVQYFVPTQ